MIGMIFIMSGGVRDMYIIAREYVVMRW